MKENSVGQIVGILLFSIIFKNENSKEAQWELRLHPNESHETNHIF